MKIPEHLGVCIYKDGLAPILEEIRNADGLMIETPNYLGDVSAVFRALYERLIFQSLTYKIEPRSYNKHRISVLFIMTSITNRKVGIVWATQNIIVQLCVTLKKKMLI